MGVNDFEGSDGGPLPTDGAGHKLPLDDETEWDSVEEERDYWKALALSYSAKLGVIAGVMSVHYVIHGPDADGEYWIEPDRTKKASVP